jgi:CHAT domain
MTKKDTRASGAGSIAIGGSARGANITAHVVSSAENNPPSTDDRANAVVANAPAAVAIGGDATNTVIHTSAQLSGAGGAGDAPIEFPRLTTPVDLLLRVANDGPGQLRFDALARDGRRAGPFQRRVANTDSFAKRLSELTSRNRSDEAQALGTLRALGMDIAGCLPTELLAGADPLLGELLARRGSAASVLILIDDAYVPWELAFVECGTAKPDRKAFLGQVARVGRWPIDDRRRAPEATLNVGGFHVFAAKSYAATGTKRDLPHALAEQEFLVENFDAIPHDATGPEISAWLRSKPSGAQTLHIAVHGYSDTKANEQSLILGDGCSITPEELLGLNVSVEPRPYSLVFINACQTGTIGETLGQVAGFPGTLARRGAGGVIAPLWEVNDREACEFAKAFYSKTLADEMDIGAALRSLRNDALRFSGVDNLAYVFFGHPLLKLQLDPSGGAHGE